MQNLIQIKNRINAIKATKKVVEAMRLIAISSYPKLIKTHALTLNFVKNIKQVLAQLSPYQSKNLISSCAHQVQDHKTLVIIAGSAKGLCGGFNSQLERFFLQALDFNIEINYEFIVLGRRSEILLEHTNVLKKHHNYKKILLPPLQQKNLHSTVLSIKEYVDKNPSIQSISVISNKFKSIFFNQPKLSKVFPFNIESTAGNPQEQESGEIIFEQKPSDILKNLSNQAFIATLHALLQESILCETTARFVTTDGAARSARKKIEQLSLTYNKIRQTAITREVTELSSSI